MKVRVLLADDHAVTRYGLHALLETHGYEIAGEASEGREAVRLALQYKPHIALMDITMPGLDGLLATQRLRKEKCRTKIILLSDYDDADFIAAAFSSGADCYVAKSRLSMDLDPAIRVALQGSHFISKSDGIAELSNAKV